MKTIITLTFILLGATLFAQNAELTGVYYQKESTSLARADSIHLSNKKVGMKNELVGSSVPCYGRWEFTPTKIIITSWCGEYGTSDSWAGEYNWKYTGIGTLQISLSYIKPTRTVAKKYNFSIQHVADGITLTRIK